MATCNAVNVQCPNGRRQKVKLTAHMTLLQVIQEVCKKQDLNPNMYNLKHQRKMLDSSITIRFANLPNNAHLELIESAEEHLHSVKKCVVALQLESGERLVHEFNSDSSLLNILLHWKSQSESLTLDDTLAGVLCIYANQQISGLEKLQATTLSMIGLNGGRGVIRIIQRSLTAPDNSENVTIKGVEAKLSEQPELLVSQDSPLVQDKPSNEEMDIASCSTSSVSMASQASEDNIMQCTEAVEETSSHSDRKDKAIKSEAGSSQSKKNGEKDNRMEFEHFESKQNEVNQSKPAFSQPNRKSGKNDDEMEFEQFESKVNETRQSKAGSSDSKKKGGKTSDAMDIQVLTGLEGEEISSSVKLESLTPADRHSPPLECVASTSGASTSRTAAQVEAFSGMGRTLSESGPDKKKPRFHSPPWSSKTDVKDSQPFRNVETSESGECLPDRAPLAFCLGDSSSISSEDISDDFFEVTVDDLRLMLKDLKNERTAEKPLMTAKMREEREKDKINQYDRVAIRVYFPDQTVLQGFFSPKETVSAVTLFVKENLAQKNTNFYLYTTPPRVILDKPNITLFEAKLFPAAIIHFGSRESQVSYLHARLLKEIADFTTAKERVHKYVRSSSSSSTHELETDSPSVAQNTAQTNKPQPEDTTVSTSAVNQGNERRENTRPNTGKAVPKWFKLGK